MESQQVVMRPDSDMDEKPRFDIDRGPSLKCRALLFLLSPVQR
jgi:hypothetical protein